MHPHDSISSLNRREFLELMGRGVGGAMLAGGPVLSSVGADGTATAPSPDAATRPQPRLYYSDRHTDARMHLGGIGTGNIEIGADGRLTTWQLFNTLRDGEVPFYFAVKAGNSAKLLQTSGGPDWPRIRRIEMQGDYPVATLRFRDNDLPVQIELDAFTPFAPLDAGFSSQPLAVFRFRVRNPGNSPQTVSLAALLANPVGYAAIGEIRDNRHPSLGWNVNEPFLQGGAPGLSLGASRGADPTLDQPVSIFLLEDVFVIPPDPRAGDKNEAYVRPDELAIPPLDRPENLKVSVIDVARFAAGDIPAAQSVIWLNDAPADLPASLLTQIKRAVEAGATLAFSGGDQPLLGAYAAAGMKRDDSAARPDIVFEDFEHGYEQWTVEGTAFGTAPVHGTLPHQQRVSGFLGQGLVNSYVNGDDATGRMTSRPFTIERNFIRFLIGGGHFKTTQIRLLIDGKIVRATSGEDNERLKPATWSVAEFAGQTAHVEIVDHQKGGWGHVNIDQIVFTDWPGDRAVLPLLDDLLPVRFTAVETVPAREARPAAISLRDPVLPADCARAPTEKGLDRYTRTVGAGKVVLLAGQLLNPTVTCSAFARQDAYAWLCSLAGARYTVTAGQSAREPGSGTLALAVLAGEATAATHFDQWNDAWSHISSQGRFDAFTSLQPTKPTPVGQTTNCALATTVSIPGGGTVEVPFLLAWHYPNKYNPAGEWIGCHYATRWPDARAVINDAIANYASLCRRTDLFRQTFYDSTLPYSLLDCLTANSAIIRHIGVVFRIANGDIYGWEGSNGSCEPTCTHVWGYEQSLARLFPELEREMRRIDYRHQQNPDGGINNRTDIPSPPHPTGERPFTDGHASCILKAYREALNSPDGSFFNDYWPAVQRAVEYLIDRDARASGGQPGGVLQDTQWNTYDEALHGVTTFISGYYLAALRAGEEWARRLGDTVTADRYHAIFANGQRQLVDLCWNGEYFQQHLPDYLDRQGEVGPGCMSDQLLGQWWAHQLGLGYILPQDKVRSALAAIFKYNWRSDLHGWKQSPRQFAGPEDQGLIVCTWPKGGRPAHVLNYSDELWTGLEYEVAALMIYEGMIQEGFTIAQAARARYDGIPRAPIIRNPWSEIECGGHYTRAMSSWSLLLALAGFHYDGPSGILRFSPRPGEDFRSFFSASEGWGSLAQSTRDTTRRVTISVKWGKLVLKTLLLGPSGTGASQVAAAIGGQPQPVEFSMEAGALNINVSHAPIVLQENQELEITIV